MFNVEQEILLINLMVMFFEYIITKKCVWLISQKIIQLGMMWCKTVNHPPFIYIIYLSPLMTFQCVTCVCRGQTVFTENKLFNIVSTNQLFDSSLLHQRIHFFYNLKVMILDYFCFWEIVLNSAIVCTNQWCSIVYELQDVKWCAYTSNASSLPPSLSCLLLRPGEAMLNRGV